MASARLFVSTILLCGALAPAVAAAGEPAETIYLGGDIITMRGEKPEYVEAIVVRAGKIGFVGPAAEAKAFAGQAGSSASATSRGR